MHHAPVYDEQGNKVPETCPFCRTPPLSTDEEHTKQKEKRAELNDSYAIYSLGCNYAFGRYGLPQNYAKALELYQRAAELGCEDANYTMLLLIIVAKAVWKKIMIRPHNIGE